MDRRQRRDLYGSEGTPEDPRMDARAPGLSHLGNLPPINPGNVHFCDGLIHGLDNLHVPPISGTSNNPVYGPPWSASTGDGVGTFPQSFGGWTSYPTDNDNETVNSPPPTTLGFISNDDYFRSLSQPDSTSSSEGGLYSSRTRSLSEHFDVLGGMAGMDFSKLTQSGQDLYAESLEQWTKKTSPEPRSYDPFGTAHMLQQQAEMPTSGTCSNIPNFTMPVEPVMSPGVNIVTSDACDTNIKNKPSYSEVAKNRPAELKHLASKKDTTASNSSHGGKSSTSKPEGFPDFTGIKRHKFHSRSHSSKSYKQKKRPALEPTTIRPNSRYGLDTFEGPVVSPKPCQGDHLSMSSGSTPQSRKGSTSSGTGSFCGIEDLDTLDTFKRSSSTEESANRNEQAPVSHTWAGLKGDAKACPGPETKLPENTSLPSEEVPQTVVNQSQNVSPGNRLRASSVRSDDGKRKTESVRVDVSESKRPRSSSCNTAGNNVKQKDAKEHVFFDPKRIFSQSKLKSTNKSATAKSQCSPNCIPNNQQPSKKSPDPQDTPKPQAANKPKADEAENILNNDTSKPKTKQNSNINRSCYINNNLRDSSSSSKKQTNADAQRDSGPATGSTPNENVPLQNSSSHSHNGRNATHPRHRFGSGSGRGSGGSRTGHQKSGTSRSESRGSSHSKPNFRPRSPLRPENTGSATSRTDQRSPSREEMPARRKAGERNTEPDWDNQFLIGEMINQCWQWIAWAGQELGYVLWNITKLTISIGLALLLMLAQYGMSAAKSVWIVVEAKIFHSTRSNSQDEPSKKQRVPCGLKENIVLPSTGDEAMKRLLACRGKDPYSILGVKVDASDDVIKKYYRKQAVLVHPDKNQTPGAEEAFKILGHAFDLIGEPEKRKQFDLQRSEVQEEEEALHHFADLLSKLHDKMQEASNLMRCENCGGKHRRVPTERPMYAARYCQKCDYNHPVREGDVWAESHMLGFLWNYYACMENRVYDITEWASCQCDRFKHIQANAHNIVYRIATNSNAGGRHRQNNTRSNEADLEDFLNHLFHQTASGGNSPGAATADGTENASQFGQQRAGSAAYNQSTNSSSAKKGGRRKKKRH